MEILTELFGNASSFVNDAYGFLTNQLSHALALGIGSYIILLVFLRLVANIIGKEWNIDREWTLVPLAILYIIFEMRVQGWNGSDTVQDWGFVMIGASLGASIAIRSAKKIAGVSLMIFAVTIYQYYILK